MHTAAAAAVAAWVEWAAWTCNNPEGLFGSKESGLWARSFFWDDGYARSFFCMKTLSGSS